jgi:hypothetical protein
MYERLRHLLYDDSEWTEEELRLQLARSAKDNGWDEAGMEAYDRYDEDRKRTLSRPSPTRVRLSG